MNEYEIKEYVEDNVDPYHSQNMYQNGNPGILLHLQLVNVPWWLVYSNVLDKILPLWYK